MRNALITAAVCAPLSLIRSCSIVLALVFGLWATTASGAVGSDLDAASRVALAAWLAGLGTHIGFAGGTWSLLPLGITAVSLWSAHRAGRRGMRDLSPLDRGAVTWFLIAFVLLHTGGVTLIGWWLSHEGVRVGVGQCAAAAAVFSLSPAIALAVSPRTCGMFPVTLPLPLQKAWVITRRALVALAAIASVALVAALVVERSQVAAVTRDYGQGVAIAAGVTAVSLIMAPTVVGWFIALFAGAPILMAQSEVSVFGDTAAALPPLPVMAAVPTSLPAWSAAALLVPLAVYALTSSRTDTATPRERAVVTALVAVLTAAFGAALTLLCSGSIGYPQWSVLGPDWRAMLFLAAASAAGSALGLGQASRAAAGQRA